MSYRTQPSCLSFYVGSKNGCPRRDPRQNFAGLDAVREGEEFDQKNEEGNPGGTPVIWDPFRSLVGGSQGPLVGRTAKRWEGALVLGSS